MAADKSLVFVSFFAAKGSAAKNSCHAIHTQLQPFKQSDPRFELWDRSMISAGTNKDDAIKAALERCRVAVVLVTAEHLVSEHWQREVVPLLAAAKKHEILLLWQEISPCNCNVFVIETYRPLIPDCVLTDVPPTRRHKLEQEISTLVFDAWRDFTPMSQRIRALPVLQPEPKASDPRVADAVALVLSPSGEDKGAMPCYQWMAFVQWAGESQYKDIPNGVIDALQSITKESLPELLQQVRSWIGRELEDVPVLEIFAPDSLLDEDWGGISIPGGEEPRHLQTYQPYLLRSSDRLLNPEWKERQGALRRMHHHLVKGTGVWLPQDQLTKAHVLENLDGEPEPEPEPELGGDVIAAICCFQASKLHRRTTWLKSVLQSHAPLVVWPSRQNPLAEEQVQFCLRQLHLNRKDTRQDKRVDRPYCPDMAQLAKARRKWNDPSIDLRGLSILVDHPDRAPDRTMLHTFFQPSREAISREGSSPAPEGERPGPQAALLISS